MSHPVDCIAKSRIFEYHRHDWWETIQMSTYKGVVQRFIAPIALAMAILLPVQPVLAAVAVGQTASANVRVDGVRVPSGTTLISPAVVETGDRGAVLHLTNGEVIAVAPDSTAVVASVDSGIRLAVQRGNVAYTSADGSMATLSSTETMMVSQEGEIQHGERIYSEEGEERLCELDDWSEDRWMDCRYRDDNDRDDDDHSCDWELLEVPLSQVPQYLELTAVLACKDRNDLGLDCNCKAGAFFVWWQPVATVAGGAVLYQVITDDDEKIASPSQP
jgi:hypothetical protein